MSSDFFKVKKGLNISPSDSSTVTSPEVGDIIVDSSDNNKLKRYDDLTSSWKDVGSGVGGINYISNNSDFEGGTVGYTTYANAAGAAPVDGTSGTATFVTIDTDSVSPLRGTKSGLISKTASNAQGQGVSYDFTIDSADQAQVLRISFDYNTEASTTSYVDGDIRVYVYDVTNSRLIEVIDRDLLASSKGKFVGTFQTSPDSVSYRLIFHVASINASAYSVKIDNVIVGPQTIVKGAIVTDWETFTPTGTWTTNTTYTGKWRRVGSDMEIQMKVSLSGFPTVATLDFNMPSGYVIDANKLELSPAASLAVVGFGFVRDASPTGTYDVRVIYVGGVLRAAYGSGTTVALPGVTQSAPITFDSGDSVTITARVPIQGWSSNVTLSDDAGNREIVFKSALQNPTSATFDGTNNLIFPASLIDTAAGYNSSTGVYTIPESGIYYIKGSVLIGGTEANNNKLELRIYKGATIINVGANTIQNSGLTYQQVNASTLYEFTKGDTVSLRVLTEITSPSIISGVQYHTFEIAKRSSPQTIAASEVVALSLQHNSGQIIPNGITTTLIPNVVIEDTHNAYNATTGIWICPQSGYYQASGSIMLNTVAGWSEGETAQITFLSNDTSRFRGFVELFATPVSTVYVKPTTISGVVYIAKGQNAYFQVIQNNDDSVGLVPAGTFNFFTITKVG